MAGTLSVQKIQGLATSATPTVVEIASGHVLSQPGSVIQVLQNTRSTYFETSSDSFVDTGFAITITPKLATSKILLQVNVFCTIQNGGQGSINIYGSAESGLLSSDTYGFGGLYDAGGSTCEGINTINFLTGVVGSTSARTYTLYGKSTGTDNSFFLNNNRLSTFTALEIAQ